MSDVTPDHATALKQSFMLGRAARGTSIAGDDVLLTLSVLGQRNRFARPLPPVINGTPVFPDDARPVVPDAARAFLLQLFAGKNGRIDDALAIETIRALRKAGLRLHPFDIAPLEDFIAKHASEFGPFEACWLRLARPNRKHDSGGGEPEELTDESFATASPAARVTSLRHMRSRDPARARRIIEGTLAGQSAQSRAQFIATLALGLTADDQALLESATNDRSKSVKDAAEALLARLPGTAAQARRLADALSLLEVKKTGLLRRKSVLALKRPNAVKPGDVGHFLAAAFDGLSLAALASGVAMTIEDFVQAAADDPALAEALHLMCVRERRIDLADILSGQVEDDAVRVFDTAAKLLPDLAETDRIDIVRSLTRPRRWRKLPPGLSWRQLYEGLGGPLPKEIAEQILDADCWRQLAGEPVEANNEAFTADLLASLAALVPASLSSRFLAEHAPVQLSLRHRAAAFHGLFLVLTPSDSPFGSR